MSYDVVRHRATPARHGSLHAKVAGRHRTTSFGVCVVESFDVVHSVNTALGYVVSQIPENQFLCAFLLVVISSVVSISLAFLYPPGFRKPAPNV